MRLGGTATFLMGMRRGWGGWRWGERWEGQGFGRDIYMVWWTFVCCARVEGRMKGGRRRGGVGSVVTTDGGAEQFRCTRSSLSFQHGARNSCITRIQDEGVVSLRGAVSSARENGQEHTASPLAPSTFGRSFRIPHCRLPSRLQPDFLSFGVQLSLRVTSTDPLCASHLGRSLASSRFCTSLLLVFLVRSTLHPRLPTG